MHVGHAFRAKPATGNEVLRKLQVESPPDRSGPRSLTLPQSQ